MNIKLLLSILSIASTSTLISQSQSIELKQIKKYNKVVKKTIKSLNKSVSKVQNITPETPLEF
jgi:hypothetical protein